MKGGDVDALSSVERTLLKKKLVVTAALCCAPAIVPLWPFFRMFGLPNESHCCQVHERLRMMPDALAALVVGSIKAVVRARQCRYCRFACEALQHEISPTFDSLSVGLTPLLTIPSCSK
jgi:hypothetical protein